MTKHPEWSLAPAWAMWWAAHAGGSASWFRTEPIIRIHFWVEGEDGAYSSLGQDANSIDIPIGIDWRLLKQQRPQVTA